MLANKEFPVIFILFMYARIYNSGTGCKCLKWIWKIDSHFDWIKQIQLMYISTKKIMVESWKHSMSKLTQFEYLYFRYALCIMRDPRCQLLELILGI